MANGTSCTRLLRLTVPLGLVAAALVMWAGPAQAATCPTVDPSTGAVSPAPGPGVQWAGCDLTGADLAGANMTQGNLSNAELANANLTAATLKGLDLGSADLTNANLTNAQLMQAILSDATFTGATLTGVSSGGISGTPSSLPSGWALVNNYLVGPGASLSNANLTGADLTDADLRGADLTDARMTSATLTSADLSGATLTGLISGGITGTPDSLPTNWSAMGGYLIGPAADLEQADLINLDLSGLTLTGADLTGADLSGASLVGANVDNAILTQVNLAGANLTGASLAGEQSSGVTGTPAALPTGWSITGGFLIGPGADLHGANLVSLRLNGADLSGADLSDTDLVDASLASANLTSADLSGASASNLNLTGASLGQANLDGAILDSANLTDAAMTGANLTDVSLDDSTLTGASLAGATLTGAAGQGLTGTPASLPTHWSVVGGFLIGPGAGTYLTDADLNSLNLTGVDFSGLNLLRATFEHANLTRANLTKANLTGADFTSANLTKADMDGATVSSTNFTATVWSDTICPNGTNSDSYAHGRCFAPPPTSPFTSRALPLPSGAPANDFIPHAISCSSATQCSAGASYAATGPAEFLGALLHWTGSAWTETEAPLPSNKSTTTRPGPDGVTAMSCPSVSRCLAAGYYESKTGNDAMLLSWSGKNWTATQAPLPANANPNPDARVNGMACPSVTSCFAVGSYSGTTGGGTDNGFGLLLRWAAGKWTAAAAPTPAGSPVVILSAVSCPSTTLCFATGEYGSGPDQEPLILRWSGGKWAVVKVALPAGAAASPQAVMNGLSCPSTTHCVAVGFYADTQGRQEGVLLTRSGTTWTAARAPVLGGAAGNPWVSLDSVSCPTASQCTVGGGYENTAAQSVGLLLMWGGQAWKAVPAPRGAYMAEGISCPTTTRCVAVSPGTSGPLALTGP